MTDWFIALAKDDARNGGMPDLPVVTVPHPLVGRDANKIQEMAEGVVWDIVQALTARTKAQQRFRGGGKAASK